MPCRLTSTLLLTLCWLPRPAIAEDFPRLETSPILRLNAGGPLAQVNALAFSRDGKTLYAAGKDKVVHVWRHDGQQFVWDANGALRVPIGVGVRGNLNALAVSGDGRWLAVGGTNTYREAPGFRATERTVLEPPAILDRDMLRDTGTIWLFDLSRERPTVRTLRGHLGAVQALAFTGDVKGTPLLASLGQEQPTSERGSGAVRLWNLERERGQEELAVSAPADLPDYTQPPTSAFPRRFGLAVARLDPDADHLWIGASWPGRFVTWSWRNGKLSRGEVKRALAGTTQTLAPAVFALPGPRFLTGNYQNKTGWLQLDGAAGEGRSLWQPPGNVNRRPMTLAAGDGRVAVALFDGKQVDLSLLTVQGERADEVGPPVKLWTGGDQPLLALAPGGRHLAVVGTGEATVHVYRLTDAGLQADPQALRGAGRRVESVAWLKETKTGQLGLRLQWTEHEKITVRLFDCGTSELQELPGQGWETNEPDLGGWQLPEDSEVRQRRQFDVRDRTGRTKTTAVQLEPGQQLTAWKFLPPAGDRPPLLAVAGVEFGELRLLLYDLRTGSPLRQFVGHVQAVSDLAFSADGRLLASTSADQTVNVWSLTAPALGKTGLIDGLALVKKADGKLHVDAVRSPALQKGDILVHMEADGKPFAPTSRSEFTRLLLRRQPNDKVKLRVLRSGEEVNVEATLTQAVDTARPLFSLLLARDDPKGWLAWSPRGDYDHSLTSLKKHLRWHVNTANPAQPVAFVDLDTYPDDFKKGFLKETVKHAERRVQAPPRVRPEFALRVENAQEIEPARYLVRALKGVTVRIAVKNLAAEQQAALTCAFAGQPVRLRPDGTGFVADLSGLDWPKRRDLTLRVRVEETEFTEREEQSLALRFVPPAPELRFKDKGLAAAFGVGKYELDADRLLIEADIVPHDGEKVTALWRLGQEREELTALTIRKETKWAPNTVDTIALEVRNADATAETSRLETTRRVLHVLRQPLAPTITLLSVGPGQPPTAADGTHLLANPEVVVVGEVTAMSPDKSLTFDGTPARWEGSRFTATLAKPLAINELRTAVLEAQAGGRTTKLLLRLYHQPRLTDVQFRLTPAEPATDGTEDVAVTLSARPFGSAANLDIDAILDGQIAKKVDDFLTWEIKVPARKAAALLRPKFRLKNVKKYGTQGHLEQTEFAHEVRCLRLPLVTRVAPDKPSDQATTAVVVTVLSPDDLKPLAARIGTQHFARLEPTPGDEQNGRRTWTFKLADVKLDDGVNRLPVVVWNDDGPSRDRPEAVAAVEYQKVKPRPKIDAGGRPVSSLRAEVGLAFRVYSESDLQGPPVVKAIPAGTVFVGKLPAPEKDDLGRRYYDIPAVTLRLDKYGVNRFVIQATNAGGAEELKDIDIDYRPVVELRLTSLEAPEKDQPRFLPLSDAGGKLSFARAGTGLVRLHGEAFWNDLADPNLEKPDLQVRAVVNHYLQPTETLGPKTGNVRKFAITLRLNAEVNRVVVNLPGVPVDHGGLEVTIPCAKPETEQRLHLLIVGINEPDVAALQTRVLQVLGVERKGEALRSERFAEVRLYETRTNVMRQKLRHALKTIAEDVRRARPARNDVLVVFFSGAEVEADDGTWLLTSEYRPTDANPRYSAVSLDEIRGDLNGAFGAQLLLFDVRRTTVKQAARKDDALNHAEFRYAWLGQGKGLEEARLLRALEESLKTAQSLKEVQQLLKNHAEEVRRQKKNQAEFAAEIVVPTFLGELKLR